MTPKETLEEAAEKYAEPYRCPATNENEYCKHDIISAINFGAKWQQERSYSEEEVKKIILDAINSCTDGLSSWYQDFDEWFEQNKKTQ